MSHTRMSLPSLPCWRSACAGHEQALEARDRSPAAQRAARPPAGPALTGAGATFPVPLYSKWFDAYDKETGVKINYQSIGSGGGISQFTEGTVDFGATDGPMTDEQIKAGKGRCCTSRRCSARSS